MSRSNLSIVVFMVLMTAAIVVVLRGIGVPSFVIQAVILIAAAIALAAVLTPTKGI